MNKSELLSAYTAEQIADMTQKRKPFTNEELIQEQRKLCKRMSDELYDATEENKRLQSEVEKYRKSFEDVKKERDCRITEYRKKIKELENRDIAEFLPTEPIKVAEMLITAKGECEPLHIGSDVFKDTYRIFEISELRQIAEHLLVYCNNQKENVNE